MQCFGCYKEGVKGYCLSCRKALFSGKRVTQVLNFDTPKADNLPEYQEKTKRLSISGVQLKYSLCQQESELILTEHNGEYILKPVAPATLIARPNQAPENEHLTMKIASQVFGIKTAENALIFFKDGTQAYITKRFDVKSDGSKYLQEDMAQLSGKTKQRNGENFKYQGTYEEIGRLIKKYVAASLPVLEVFFKTVLFNYLFSNGDAHMKNFSLIQTDQGDYTLTPAYDLMSTMIHTPQESDTALDLYEGDMESSFYSRYGFYGKPDFEVLANKIGLLPQRIKKIIDGMLSEQVMVLQMINKSFLSEDAKAVYAKNYLEKVKRMNIVL
jgi:serine/threonine-protein kinase HipA